MKTLADQMSFYAAYHQDARNKATHFVGVPVIVFSLMIPLGWLRAEIGGVAVSGALAATALLALYYLVLDVPLGLAMAAIFALMLWGHVYEGRKPTLVDNLFQVFVAPIFLAAEVFFALGYKPALHEEVQRRALQLRAQAGIASAAGDLTSA